MPPRTDQQTKRDPDFEELLEYIKTGRGFDFTGYKRPSLARRVDKRMEDVGCDTYKEYLSLLEAQPHEFAELFNTILINVTSFFRDPEAWDYVREEIVPRILAAKAGDAHVRGLRLRTGDVHRGHGVRGGARAGVPRANEGLRH